MKQLFLTTVLLLLCSVIPGQSQVTEWITPTNVTASGTTILNGNVGAASNAIDGNPATSWLSDSGQPHNLQFDLGSNTIVRGVQVSWIDGGFCAGNRVCVYVDGIQVVTNAYFLPSPVTNTVYFPATTGRVIKYETVNLPNAGGSTANFAQVGEFRAFIQMAAVDEPALTIERAVRMTYPTQAGVIYQPQISSNMTNWVDYGSTVTGDGTTKEFWYVADPSTMFFRVQVQ